MPSLPRFATVSTYLEYVARGVYDNVTVRMTFVYCLAEASTSQSAPLWHWFSIIVALLIRMEIVLYLGCFERCDWSDQRLSDLTAETGPDPPAGGSDHVAWGCSGYWRRSDRSLLPILRSKRSAKSYVGLIPIRGRDCGSRGCVRFLLRPFCAFLALSRYSRQRGSHQLAGIRAGV